MQTDLTFNLDDFQDIKSQSISQQQNNQTKSNKRISSLLSDQYESKAIAKGYFIQHQIQNNENDNDNDDDSPTKMLPKNNNKRQQNRSRRTRNKTDNKLKSDQYQKSEQIQIFRNLQKGIQNSKIRRKRREQKNSVEILSNNKKIQYIQNLQDNDNSLSINDGNNNIINMNSQSSNIIFEDNDDDNEGQRQQNVGRQENGQMKNESPTRYRRRNKKIQKEKQHQYQQSFIQPAQKIKSKHQSQLKQKFSTPLKNQFEHQSSSGEKRDDEQDYQQADSDDDCDDQNQIEQQQQYHNIDLHSELNQQQTGVEQPPKQLNMFRILTSPIPDKLTMKTVVERKAGFMNLWPEFHVTFEADQCYLMSGKKVSRTPYSTFVLATHTMNFEENSQFYLGKAKSTVLGDQLDMFGVGFSPKNAFEKKVKPRQLIATVVYQTRYFEGVLPRNFKVYLKNPEFDYYSDFPEVKMYEEEISLNVLYKNPHNRDKIILLRNRKPQFRKQMNGYMLNFKGRVSKPSVKNFVLQDVNDPTNELMIFGKFEQQKFHMDISYPLSPCVAFGIVLSTFDSKYFCE